MMKEDQLLDDFALINAFDQAISKYKKMHGKDFEDCSTNDVLPDDVSNNRDIPQNEYSNPEKVGSEKENGSHIFVVVEEEEAGNLETFTEDEVIDSQISKDDDELEPCSLPPQNQSQEYTSSTTLDEYNMLYKQYYEIEEQRQKILQKMQQFSNEYYPDYVEPSVSGVQWGADSAAQQFQDASQTPCGTVTVSCCPCACQCSAALSAPLNSPSSSAHGAGPRSTKGLETSTSVENVDFVAALGAAERALSALKDDISGSEKENRLSNVLKQNADSETDLSTVLNAWYAAGLYTGKYLTEKSLAKKRHD